MQSLNIGDLVLVINCVYNPDNIGRAGTVVHGEEHFCGTDKFGLLVSGRFVIVDLPGAGNRHGTTLWYYKAKHLLRIAPGDTLQDSELCPPHPLLSRRERGWFEVVSGRH